MEGKKKYSKQEVETLLRELRSDYEKTSMKQRDRIFELKSSITELEKQLEQYREREAQISKALTFAVQKAGEIEDAAKQKYLGEIEHLRAFAEKWQSYYNKLIQKYPIDDNIREIEVFNKQLSEIFSGDLDSMTRTSENDAGKIYEREKKRVSEARSKKNEYISEGHKLGGVLSETEPDERYEKIVKAATRKKTPKIKDELAYYKPETLTNSNDTAVPPRSITEYLEKPQTPTAKTKSDKVAKNALGAKTYGAPVPPSDSGFSIEEALNPTQDLEEIMRDLGLIFDGDIEV